MVQCIPWRIAVWTRRSSWSWSRTPGWRPSSLSYSKTTSLSSRQVSALSFSLLDLPIYLYLFVNLSIHLSLPLSYILECHRWLLLMRRPRRDRRSGPRGSSTEASSFIPVSSSLIPRLVLCFAFIFLLFCKQENCRDEGFCDLRLFMFRNIRFQIRIRIHCIWPDPDPLQSSLRNRIHFDFFSRIRIHLKHWFGSG